jgi:hypothetical protein
MNRLRIRGLVKAERYVRDAIVRGVPKCQLGPLKQYVDGVIKSVRDICGQHHSPVDELPVPSRNAFRFLSGLRIADPPEKPRPARKVSAKPKPPVQGELPLRTPTHRARVKSVVKSTRTALDAVSAMLDIREPPDVVNEVAPTVRQMAGQIDGMCQKQGCTPADMAPPSRNAYSLLAYLAMDGTMDRYVSAVASVKRLLRDRFESPLHTAMIRLDNHGGIYHLRRRNGEETLRLNPGFIAADEEILGLLLQDALKGRRADRWKPVHQFVHSEAFQDVRQQMEELVASENGPRGGVFDLAEVCETVRKRDFDPPVERPRSLSWTQVMTHHTFGHYNSVLDRVTISRSLDDAQVPRFVIEFVMYHELLHKHHGIGLTESGRRRMHTHRFRLDEKRFPQYTEAEAFLSKLSGRLRRSRRR